jgi:hypothetical protein
MCGEICTSGSQSPHISKQDNPKKITLWHIVSKLSKLKSRPGRGSSGKSICLASVRPRVLTPVLPKEKPKKQTDMFEMSKTKAIQHIQWKSSKATVTFLSHKRAGQERKNNIKYFQSTERKIIKLPPKDTLPRKVVLQK